MDKYKNEINNIIKKEDIITKDDCKDIKLFDVIEYNNKNYHCNKQKVFNEEGKLCGIILNKKIILYVENNKNFHKICEKYDFYKKSLLKKI